MLQLFANNIQLDTAGVKFNLTLKNPMFMRDTLEGSYIFNFNLPASDRNRAILDFPDRMEKHDQTWKDYDCRILFNGHTVVDNSTISVKETNENVFVANVKVGTGNFFYQVQDKTLKDIDLGGNRLLGSSFEHPISYFNSIVNGGYPNYDFTLFPVKNPTFYKGTRINDDWETKYYYANYYKEGSFYHSSADGSGGTYTPFPYVPYLIDRIFNTHGYVSGKNQFLLNADLLNLVIYSNFTNVTTFAYTDPGPPATIIQSPVGSKYVNLRNYVPDLKVLDFIQALKLFGVSLFINDKTREFKFLFLKDVINSTAYKDITSSIIKGNKKEKNDFDGYRLAYDFNNDDYADNHVKTSLDDYNVLAPVSTFSNLVITIDTKVNDVRLVEDVDKYYVFNYDETFGYDWRPLSHRFQDLNDGNENYKFNSMFSPLLMVSGVDDHEDRPSARIWEVPVIEQAGTNPYFLDENGFPFKNDAGLKFLFFRGMQKDSANNDYPMGSNDVYDRANNKIANANLSLKWEGQYGLYENCLKDYLDWRKRTIPAEFKRRMDPVSIFETDFSEKHRIDRVDYIIDEIKIPFTEKEIGDATLKCWKV